MKTEKRPLCFKKRCFAAVWNATLAKQTNKQLGLESKGDEDEMERSEEEEDNDDDFRCSIVRKGVKEAKALARSRMDWPCLKTKGEKKKQDVWWRLDN